MSEASRSRVTITLGRTGQVVKRAGSASNDALSDLISVTGRKPSIRDRLGSNANSSLLRGSLYHESRKRQREDTGMSNLNANGVNDVPVGKGDLRYKLMQKKASRRTQNDNDQKLGDLRQKLSKEVRPPLPIVDSRQRVPEPKETGFMGQIPSRSADDMHRMESSRSSYSPWTLDHLRRRSPERNLGASRGLSPPRGVDELQRRPISRTLKDFRSVPYMSKEVIDTSRAMSSVAYTPHSSLPPGPSKPVPPPQMNQLPLSNSIFSRSLYPVGDATETVDGLLHSLGLGKYAIIFKAEEVDMAALKQMGENDLKELGVPMGPRKKILLSLLSRYKRQQ